MLKSNKGNQTLNVVLCLFCAHTVQTNVKNKKFEQFRTFLCMSIFLQKLAEKMAGIFDKRFCREVHTF